MSMDSDTFLKRAGGSLAKFTGTSLKEIKLVNYDGRRKLVLLWLVFLKGIKEAGFAPEQAKGLVDTFMMFEDAPQVLAGGTMEVGGRIDNVRETEMGIDVGIEFAAPAMPFLGGSSASLDAGFSYRTLDREQTSQNFKSSMRWALSSGPAQFTPEGFLKAAEMVLADSTIEIPELDPKELNDSSDLLSSAVIPFLTGIMAPAPTSP